MPVDTIKHALAACAFAWWCGASAHAASVAFHPLQERLRACDPAQWAVTAPPVDLDGDGRNELVYACYAPFQSPTINVLGLDEHGTLVIEHAWMPELPPLPVLGVTAWRDVHGGHVGIWSGGRLERYSGWPPLHAGTVVFEGIAPNAYDTQTIVDVDGDGTAELVRLVADPPRLEAYAVPGGHLRWSVPLAWSSGSGRALRVTQLDHDAALEIAVLDAGGDVAIVDGGTRAVTYHVRDRMNLNNMVAARLLPDAGALLEAGVDAWTLHRAAPWATVWTQRPMPSRSALATGDVDGDGIHEIVFRSGSAGDGTLRAMKVLDATPRVLASDAGASWLALVDLDADGRAEIVEGGSDSPAGGCFITVRDGVTSAVRSSRRTTCFPRFRATPFLEEADGTATDFILDSNAAQGSLSRVEAATGRVVWNVPYAPLFDDTETEAVGLVARGGDGQPEVYVNHTLSTSGWLAFHDTTTGALKHTVRIGGSGLGGAPRMIAIREDLDGNAQGIVACMVDGRVREFRYSDGAHLWTVPATDPYCVNVWVHDGAIVSYHLSAVPLTAYDATTRQLRWQASSGTETGKVLPLVARGLPVRYLFANESDARVFDPATGTFVHAFPLPADMPGYLITDLVLPPGGDLGGLVVRTHNSVLAMDGWTGDVRARVDNLAPLDVSRGSLSVGSVDGRGRYLVAAIADHAWWTFALDLPPDRIHADGFDR